MVQKQKLYRKTLGCSQISHNNNSTQHKHTNIDFQLYSSNLVTGSLELKTYSTYACGQTKDPPIWSNPTKRPIGGKKNQSVTIKIKTLDF